VSDEEIQDIVMTANLTPRKCLGFKTPLQAILKELGKTCKSGLLSPVALGARIQAPLASRLASRRTRTMPVKQPKRPRDPVHPIPLRLLGRGALRSRHSA
jgi:hypothetical protein